VRIIGGAHRGRQITAPRGRTTRPTADRARESVCNILTHGIDWTGFDGAFVLDVFAGTGAYGLESLSRGAARLTAIDRDAAALAALRRNAAALGEAGRLTELRLDATRLPPPPRTAAVPADLAFLDPPYDRGLAEPALSGLAGRGWLKPNALCVVEVAAGEPLPLPPGFTLEDERVYGAARVCFVRFG
jgi:16S rRNA (guanine966-N2)-methyltransferase